MKRALVIGYIVIFILQAFSIVLVIFEEHFDNLINHLPEFLTCFNVPGFFLAHYLFGVELFDKETPQLYAQLFGCNLVVLLLAYTFVIILFRLLYGALRKHKGG